MTLSEQLIARLRSLSPAAIPPDVRDAAKLHLLDAIGVEDDALEGVEYRESLRPLLAQLAPRERQILMLRFFHDKTQSEIAAEVGISQMHVSRLLAKTLAQLRTGLLTED